MRITVPGAGGYVEVDIPEATASSSGVMPASSKSKLDSLTYRGLVDVRDYASFTDAVNTIGNTPTMLLIPSVVAAAGPLIVPSTLGLMFISGGQLSISSGTVTIKGPINAPLSQIFSGAGSVVFAPDATDYLYPQWWGAVGHDLFATDSTSAFQAAATASAASGNLTVFIPNGTYKISGTITCHQGTKFIGAGSQGSNYNYGTTIKHFASNANLFVWDGNGVTAAGTGGGISHLLIIKANTFSGGDAIYVTSIDDNHRPGEMIFEDILIYGESAGALWSRGLHVDGTANNTSGGRGIRSISLFKFRVADVDGTAFPDEAIYLTQVTHFFAHHLQIDVGISPGSVGMTIDGNWDQVFLATVEINGDLVVDQPPDGTYFPNLFVAGRVGANFTNNSTTVVGMASITSSAITNSSGSFDVHQVGVSLSLHENVAVSGSLSIRAGTGQSGALVPATVFSSVVQVGSTVAGGEADADVYVMPSGTLNVNGQALQVRGAWTHANNSHLTTCKLYVAGTAVANFTCSTANDVPYVELFLVRVSGNVLTYNGRIDSNGVSTVIKGTLSGVNFTASITVKTTVTGAVSDGDLISSYLTAYWFSS